MISACVDDRDVVRREQTQALWDSLANFDAWVCPVVTEEIEATADASRREAMLERVRSLRMIAWREEMERLAMNYLDRGVFPRAMIYDARHVAAAVVESIPVLVSWNFRHLVNRTRRMKVNGVNTELGFPPIEIIAPPELA